MNPHPKLSNRFSFPVTSQRSPTSPRPSASDLSGLSGAAGTIVIGYRGTFAFGKDGLSDVKFRKLTRILVHGKVSTSFLNMMLTAKGSPRFGLVWFWWTLSIKRKVGIPRGIFPHIQTASSILTPHKSCNLIPPMCETWQNWNSV